MFLNPTCFINGESPLLSPTFSANAMCLVFSTSADFSLSSAYHNHSNMRYLLPFPFTDVCSFGDVLPLPMDIPPLIRPVLPSPLKHEGTRRAAVTQWDFFYWTVKKHICRYTNKNTGRQTSWHAIVIIAHDRTYSDAIVWLSWIELSKCQFWQMATQRTCRDTLAHMCTKIHKNIHKWTNFNY